MSDQNSIFGNNQNSGNPTDTAGTSNSSNANTDAQIADLLNSIKNERGEPKYKNLQDAIVGLKNAQEYIPTLKQSLTEREKELAELRATANRAAELEETVRRLTSEGTQGTPPKVPSTEDIAALVTKAVETTLTERQRASTQQANTQLVVEKLKTKFGDKAETVYIEKAKELGVTVEEFNRLAANTPKVILTALGVMDQNTSVPNTSSAPSGGSVNTAALQPRNDSSVGRNQKGILVGATSQDLIAETQNARKMADELAAQGLSVYDLTDPKVYRKHFGKV